MTQIRHIKNWKFTPTLKSIPLKIDIRVYEEWHDAKFLGIKNPQDDEKVLVRTVLIVPEKDNFRGQESVKQHISELANMLKSHGLVNENTVIFVLAENLKRRDFFQPRYDDSGNIIYLVKGYSESAFEYVAGDTLNKH